MLHFDLTNMLFIWSYMILEMNNLEQAVIQLFLLLQNNAVQFLKLSLITLKTDNFD